MYYKRVKCMPKDRSREKFIELAESRVTKALKAIHLVGNLSNRSNYKYDDSDAQKIIKALEAEIKVVKNRFSTGGSDKERKFKL